MAVPCARGCAPGPPMRRRSDVRAVVGALPPMLPGERGQRPPRDVDVLSDTSDDQEERSEPPRHSAGDPPDHELSKDSYTRRILRACPCSKKCHVWCQSNLSRCWAHRQAWAGKAKTDQDRELFNHIVRAVAVHRKRRQRYHVLGQDFCVKHFQALWGVGSQRFRALRAAAAAGHTCPPKDQRFRKRPLEKKAPRLPEVQSYFEELYEMEAEPLAENVEGVDAPWERDPEGTGIDLHAEGLGCRAPDAREKRYLPPGSMKEHWRHFCEIYPAVCCSYFHFTRVWKADWAHCLAFRTIGQHAECATCMRHKIVIRALAGDSVARARAASHFQEHKDAERRDRRVYWGIRSEARRTADVLSLINDGADQGKFACPRYPYALSKDLEGMQRPRLHVNACLCHGQEVLVTVSPPDFPKDSNGTCELIAHMLTRLKQKGVAVHRSRLHVQLDNTSSTNKNNIVLGFLAWLVAAGVVRSAEADFLRVGHTHEDVDQFHGQVCSWLHHKPWAETPHDFVRHIQRFLDTLTQRPWPQSTGDRRCVFLNQQRDWKQWLTFVPALKNHTGPRALSPRLPIPTVVAVHPAC